MYVASKVAWLDIALFQFVYLHKYADSALASLSTFVPKQATEKDLNIFLKKIQVSVEVFHISSTQKLEISIVCVKSLSLSLCFWLSTEQTFDSHFFEYIGSKIKTITLQQVFH